MKRMEAVNRQHSLIAIGLVSLLLVPTLLQAEGLLQPCHHCGKTCHPHKLVETTVMCPVKVIETRVKPCVVEKCEERVEKYTAFRCVEDTRTFKKECCYLLDEVKSKEVIDKQCQLVDVHVSRSKNVQVPQYELAETCVQKQVCTTCGPVCIEERCLEEKARLVPGSCEEQDTEKQLLLLETKKDIFYCVKTPKKQTIETAKETIYKLEPVEKTRTVQVMVPKIEYQPYEVEVTRMLPKKVFCCVSCSSHIR